MKKALLTAITAGTATALIAASTPAMAAEVTSGRWANDDSRYCDVSFTQSEVTNLARIQKQAAQNYRDVFESERGNFTAAELAFLDHARISYGDRSQAFYDIPLPDLTDEEIAASDAKMAEVRAALIAELDEANGSKNDQMLEYETFASELGRMDFFARVSVDQLASAEQYNSKNAALATAINPDYSAEDELKFSAATADAHAISDRWGTEALRDAAREFYAAYDAQLIVAGRACAEAFNMTTAEHPLQDDIADEESDQKIARMKEIIASGEIPENPRYDYFYTQPLEGEHTVADGVTMPRGQQDFPRTGIPEFDQSLVGKVFGALMVVAGIIGVIAYYFPLGAFLPGLLGFTSS